MTAHETIKSNWLLFQSGKITLAELLSRNDEIAPKSEVREAMPRHISQAANIMGGKVIERGCPRDKDGPDGPGWNS